MLFVLVVLYGSLYNKDVGHTSLSTTKYDYGYEKDCDNDSMFAVGSDNGCAELDVGEAIIRNGVININDIDNLDLPTKGFLIIEL
jgi:hypothetical protein